MTALERTGGAEPLAVLLPGFTGTALPPWLEARLRDGLAGVCLFAENIASPAQLRELTDAIRTANPLAVIAIDEEGGDVTRLHAATGSPYPGNALLGRIDDLELTAEVGRTVARELRAAGVGLNFAPDADVNSNPDNPVIGVRSFGADPRRVAEHVAAWVAAHEAEGVATSAKHYPGHGDTAEDSHLALPVVDRSPTELAERELVPFAAAIRAGARTIMTSHLLLPRLDPERPATFSPAVLGALRRDLAFDGVIVTDALDMAGASGRTGIPAAAVRALAAGCDLLCLGTRNTDAQLDAIVAAVAEALDRGDLDAGRLDDAAGRVRSLASGLAAPSDAAAPEPSFDAGRVLAAFDIRPGTAPVAHAPIVVLETTANIAVGATPWGPAAAGADVLRVREGDPVPALDVAPVLVGIANHRHAWVRALVEAVRAEHPDTVVVDMGWPSPDRAYADVATFGASRLAGTALLEWRSGAVR